MLSCCVFHTGCDPLEYDAQVIRRNLQAEYGMLPAGKHDADVIVYLGCSFSEQKEREFESVIDELLDSLDGRLLVVSGCYLREYRSHSQLRFARKEEVVAVVGEYIRKTDHDGVSGSMKLPEHGPVIAISEGCYGQCSFCSIKLVRGRHRSRPLRQILEEVAEASAVYPVIKLAAQDVAAYGRDCSVTLGSLLRALFKEFPSIKVKLGPLNPEWLMKSSDGDLGLLGRNNMVGNIHIPLQSASDAILRPMNKRYPYRAFAALWEKLLRLGVTSLSTDLMAGFPGERQRDHEMNLEFLETHRLEFAQIFMYQPRPGTQAATYKQLPYRIRLERTVDLIAKYIGAYMRFHGIALNQLLCGKQIIPPFNSNVDFRRE